MNEIATTDLYQKIAQTLEQAKQTAQSAVNSAMVFAYWEIGRLIVEDEQGGAAQAKYGKATLKHLSERLTAEFGKGFDPSNLRRIRAFYLKFPNRGTVSHELSWSHYRHLIKVEDPKAREWYIQEAASEHWSVRQLERQITTDYFQRRLASKNDPSVIAEANEKLSKIAPQDILKDPYVLEFLDLPDSSRYHESELEEAIISRLQDFLLELGKGFCFVARQKHIKAEDDSFFIDLVFYNYILKCFVLIDLKTEKLTHQDIGQIDMYVRMFDDLVKPKEDNPTIGIVLCKEKNNTVVKYSVLDESKQLFASKYQTVLPSEEELRQQIEDTVEQNENYKEDS